METTTQNIWDVYMWESILGTPMFSIIGLPKRIFIGSINHIVEYLLTYITWRIIVKGSYQAMFIFMRILKVHVRYYKSGVIETDRTNGVYR